MKITTQKEALAQLFNYTENLNEENNANYIESVDQLLNEKFTFTDYFNMLEKDKSAFFSHLTYKPTSELKSFILENHNLIKTAIEDIPENETLPLDESVMIDFLNLHEIAKDEKLKNFSIDNDQNNDNFHYQELDGPQR